MIFWPLVHLYRYCARVEFWMKLRSVWYIFQFVMILRIFDDHYTTVWSNVHPWFLRYCQCTTLISEMYIPYTPLFLIHICQSCNKFGEIWKIWSLNRAKKVGTQMSEQVSKKPTFVFFAVFSMHYCKGLWNRQTRSCTYWKNHVENLEIEKAGIRLWNCGTKGTKTVARKSLKNQKQNVSEIPRKKCFLPKWGGTIPNVSS